MDFGASKKLWGGWWWWWVHLDYNVSSLALFCQKSMSGIQLCQARSRPGPTSLTIVLQFADAELYCSTATALLQHMCCIMTAHELHTCSTSTALLQHMCCILTAHVLHTCSTFTAPLQNMCCILTAHLQHICRCRGYKSKIQILIVSTAHVQQKRTRKRNFRH